MAATSAAMTETGYGTRHDRVLSLIEENADLAGRLHPPLPHLRAEVVHAVREESALMLSDLLRRRTLIALGPHRANAEMIGAALELMASELNWSQEERENQKRAYLNEIA